MKLKIFFVTFIVVSIGFAQKKEKTKGNKLVKVKQHELAAFDALSIGENIEVFILKGATPMIEIEADENLHDLILFDVSGNTLSLKTSHKITSKKKLSIRITITDIFNKIELRDKAVLNSLIDIELQNLQVFTRDASKLYLTATVNDFKLTTQKKSKIELNLNSDHCKIEMSESSDIKALINANELQFDLYQKANAKIEGETNNLRLRADNATNFRGDKLTAQNCTMIAEGSSDCHVEVKENLAIEAAGSSEIFIYNIPKIALNKFEDSARIYKK